MAFGGLFQESTALFLNLKKMVGRALFLIFSYGLWKGWLMIELCPLSCALPVAPFKLRPFQIAPLLTSFFWGQKVDKIKNCFGSNYGQGHNLDKIKNYFGLSYTLGMNFAILVYMHLNLQITL